MKCGKILYCSAENINMTDYTPYIIIIIFTIVAVVFFYQFFFSEAAVIKRRLKKAPLKNINMFKDGDTAKIIGKAELVGEPLIAPLSGRECCYYHVIVEKEDSSGESSNWKKIIDAEVSTKFLISNNGYYAYINADDKILSYIDKDMNYNSGLFNDPTPAFESFLKKYGHASKDWFGFNKAIRYKEGIIENGETIAVLGKGEWKDAEILNLPAHYGKILYISACEEKRVIYISDDESTVARV